jgi:hypothetical protein
VDGMVGRNWEKCMRYSTKNHLGDNNKRSVSERTGTNMKENVAERVVKYW